MDFIEGFRWFKFHGLVGAENLEHLETAAESFVNFGTLWPNYTHPYPGDLGDGSFKNRWCEMWLAVLISRSVAFSSSFRPCFVFVAHLTYLNPILARVTWRLSFRGFQVHFLQIETVGIALPVLEHLLARCQRFLVYCDICSLSRSLTLTT